jgi:hypothetical protein
MSGLLLPRPWIPPNNMPSLVGLCEKLVVLILYIFTPTALFVHYQRERSRNQGLDNIRRASTRATVKSHFVGRNLTYFIEFARTLNAMGCGDSILVCVKRQRNDRRKPTHDYAVHSKLLSMYIESVPHFVPPTDSDACAPTLWHL